MPFKKLTLAVFIGILLFPSCVFSAQMEIDIGMGGIPGFIIQTEVRSIKEIKQGKVVMQQRDYSCGSASLATLFNFFLGEDIREIEIIKTLLDLNKERGTLEKVIERKGFSLLDLKKFSEEKGFVAKGFRLDFEDLIGINLPAIVPIIPNGYKHFVVFKGSKNGRVYLADPSLGNITEPVEKFKKDWYGFTNVALVIYPSGYKENQNTPVTISELDDIFIPGADQHSFLNPSTLPILPRIQGEF